MKNKIAIISGGDAGLSTLVSKLAAEIDCEMVSIEEVQPQYAEVFKINKPPELKVFEGKEKPTCKKHHEYTEKRIEDGNHLKSEWRCRFCHKLLGG